MKLLTFTTAFLIGVLCDLPAQEAQDQPRYLASLMAGYRGQRTNGVVLLNQRFLKELGILKKKYMAAGDLDSTNAVQVEIDRLEAENDKLKKNISPSIIDENIDWKPSSIDDLKKLLQAQRWYWIERGNNQRATFMDDSRLKIEGKQGNFGWEVTGARDVTLLLGAARKQPMHFRLSTTKRELQPTEGTAESRKVTLKPFAK